MLSSGWMILKDAVKNYMADNALSRGAAIAYYTVFSMAPVLVIVIAIASLAFGRDAAEGAIVGQLSGLMGKEAATALQSAIRSANVGGGKSSILATVVGVITLLITASGVFGEMQSALNIIWKAEPKTSAVSRLLRARAASLGLVMVLGFLLMVSLVVSSAIAGLSKYLDDLYQGADILLIAFNFLISFLLIAILFGAIYKVLPDKKIEWGDVIVGAITSSFLFSVGKFLISLYIGSSAATTSYGAAGALLIILLWVYYSSQLFLFGAEFTKAYAERHGSHARSAPVITAPADASG